MATLRPFQPADLNKLAKCNLDEFTETYELSFYLEYYARWPALFQVAEDQHGNIIGYIMGKLETSPAQYQWSKHFLPWHAHITAVTVAPEVRRLGIGRLLTEQVEEAADASDAFFVDLFVRRSNLKAIAFYESMGYSVFRVVRGYYSDDGVQPAEDALDMRKPMRCDTKRKHVRADGLSHIVRPQDVW